MPEIIKLKNTNFLFLSSILKINIQNEKLHVKQCRQHASSAWNEKTKIQYALSVEKAWSL
jgi:hypothetical protein